MQRKIPPRLGFDDTNVRNLSLLSLSLVSLSVCDSVSVVVLYSSSAVATNHTLTPRSGNGAVILYMRRRRYDRGHPGPRERCRPNAISCLVQCNGNREPEPWRWN